MKNSNVIFFIGFPLVVYENPKYTINRFGLQCVWGFTWKVGEHSLVVSNPYQILTSFSLFSIDSVRDIPVSKSGGQQQSG
jgi:hypothetical protein